MYSQDIVVKDSNAVVAASQTAQQVSEQFTVEDIQTLYFKVRAKVASVTAGAGISMIVQQRISDEDTWATAGTAAITAAGMVEVLFNNTASQTNLPLLPQLRVVCTTGVGSAVTFSHIWIPRQQK